MDTTWMGDVGELLTGVATFGLVVGAFVAAFHAYAQHRVAADQALEQVRESRGRWLMELSARFSDTPRFVKVREQLHHKEDSELVRALVRRQAGQAGPSASSLTDQEAEWLVALDDYLDFLGLIEYLVAREYLEEDAASNLFDWYAMNQLDIAPIEADIGNSFELVFNLRKRFTAIRERAEGARLRQQHQQADASEAPAAERPTQ